MFGLRFLILQIFCTTMVLATFDIVLILPNDAYVTSNPELPQGYVRHSDVKTAYKIYSDRLTWSQARDKCISEGARLAVVDSSEKLDRIKNIRQSRRLIWTGIHRESRTSDWTSADGGFISPNMPRVNYMPIVYGDCVAVIGYNFTTRLISQPCEYPRGYVCEIPDAQ